MTFMSITIFSSDFIHCQAETLVLFELFFKLLKKNIFIKINQIKQIEVREKIVN